MQSLALSKHKIFRKSRFPLENICSLLLSTPSFNHPSSLLTAANCSFSSFVDIAAILFAATPCSPPLFLLSLFFPLVHPEYVFSSLCLSSLPSPQSFSGPVGKARERLLFSHVEKARRKGRFCWQTVTARRTFFAIAS